MVAGLRRPRRCLLAAGILWSAVGGHALAARPAGRSGTERKTSAIYAEALKLADAGDCRAALERLRALFDLDARHWQGWQLAGNCLLAEGQRALALKAYRCSLKLHPDNPALKAWLASQPESQPPA